ncbi:hypothetical protein CC78DRAFT_585199 [Lojkania enalia]|uniref:Xylanolytic transcriptional activator regulatory domain-containing protein n=1 Tax=Lojkania enalia TaxID=147567 RepID=A0A9P4K4P8_9PLEO|nr:hypothetical protein CC78DRAFT_585199 [Didymosphaeria enalia]
MGEKYTSGLGGMNDLKRNQKRKTKSESGRVGAGGKLQKQNERQNSNASAVKIELLMPSSAEEMNAPVNGLATTVRRAKFPICASLGRKSPNNRLLQRPLKSRGQKRSLTESIDPPVLAQSIAEEEPQDGLKAWGYMPGHDSHELGNSGTIEIPEVDRVLHVIPPRSLTDSIVNHFLTVVNFRYNSIYAPTFTEQYVQWWSDRANNKPLSPEFTCLLLRICAYSVQYLTIPLRKSLEFELACNSQQLTERFSTAAEQLSTNFTASNTSVERVQEQFLKGAWLKSESKMVESWHALGCTIREAQELGINKNTSLEGLAEFDIELRRRLWLLLYIWDWQMSAWLGRPHLIDQKDCSFTFPNLRLDTSTAEPNLVSPFAHIALQAMLARRLSLIMGDVLIIPNLTGEQVLAVEAECEQFIEELPAVFRLDDPDLSLDEQYPYYVFQRCQLHVVIYMTMLDFLKPYLTKSPNERETSHDRQFRTMGVDISLKLLKVSRKLFDHEFPINAKFHLVVFSIFDTATILCSAIIHDTNRSLSHREEVMGAIECALDMLHQLSLTTKIGASSYRFLFKLVQAAPVLSQYPSMQKRRRADPPALAPPFVQPPTVKTLHTELSQAEVPNIQLSTTLINSTSEIPTTDDLSFDLDQFLEQNPFETSNQLDMGGLEQIWDWDNLNLDFLNQNPPT